MEDTGIAIIVCGVVLGMQFIHSRDIVHRDFEPANVVINAHGYPWIINAGIARLLDFNIAATTQPGSPAYWAPEMYTGE
jgi:serine/threonine protein kinase